MIATYRLQLTPDFGFDEARAQVPYFKRLGVSHLYLSPVTEARPGSDHGYDVIDHNQVRAEYGGREGFERLRAAAVEAGLGLILDFVPNHAGVGPRNVYWQDVLAYGRHSAYAHYFDVDWDPIKPELHDKILLPFLGRPYGEVLDDGEIAVAYEDGRFYAAYYENRYALNPATYDVLLERALPAFERTDAYWDLKDLHEAYRGLAPGARDKAEALRLRLEALMQRLAIEPQLEGFTGLALHRLLERQFWRLSYWKTAGYEINYRRFFNINELVALRMEDEQVFWDSHRLLGELLSLPGVDGVRIDHVDGLSDPHQYLQRLRDLGAAHVWVEKILAPGETLPDDWPTEGATGYTFMNDVMGVLLQPEGELPLDRSYRRYLDEAPTYEGAVYRSKVLVMNTTLQSELFRLSYELDRLSEADYHTRDFTLEALREALTEVVAAVDRYRTYLPYDPDEAREVLQHAIYRARQRNPAAEPTVYEFIARAALGDVHADLRDEQQAWTRRFQQYTAPVAAKGVEDTAFYRYVRLTALCEVGGEPDHFGTTPQAFHAHARYRAFAYPRSLVATATHDHKRGEDTRMRLLALAETPAQWDETVAALEDVAAAHRGERRLEDADEYLFFQTLVALWHGADRDTLPDRLWAYVQKASRESKQTTSWLNPDDAYEAALETFVRGVATDARTPDAVGPLAERLADLGFFNTLSQTVLKLTTAGVPDLYQGTEHLDLSLVDPDNRAPVDYDARRAQLDAVADLLGAPDVEVLRAMLDAHDPQAKFYAVARLLQVRRACPELFTRGEYVALAPEGDGADHWLAYARRHGDAACLVLVGRFPATFADHRTAAVPLPDDLAGHTWHDALSGRRFDALETLETDDLPLAWGVLVKE